MVPSEIDLDVRIRQGMAERLHDLCAALLRADNLTDKNIALACGVADPGTWSNYITGKRKIPYSVVVKLWHNFGAEPAWLIAGEAKRNDPSFQAKLNALLKRGSPRARRGRPRSTEQ